MKTLNILSLSLAMFCMVQLGSAQVKDMDPGVPLNPDDIQNAETINFDDPVSYTHLTLPTIHLV